jgi:hypothetical protein
MAGGGHVARTVLEIEVTASGGVQAYWVDVDNVVIPTANGKGAIALDSGTHILGWHFVGNSGATLKIAGTVGTSAIVQAKGTIPLVDDKAHGAKPFEV